MEGSNDDTSSSSELKQEEEELTFSLNHQLTYSPEISVFECSDNAEVKFRPSSPSEELLLLTEEQEEIEVTAEADLKGYEQHVFHYFSISLIQIKELTLYCK